MNQQYIEGVQKWEEAYLMIMDSKIVIAMLSLLYKGKESKNETSHMTVHLPTNGHAYSPREIIIFCLSTYV